MRAKKSLGQHFLTSASALQKIVDAAALAADDTVLEIGPGKGVLTHELLQRAGRVVAVEKDSRLIPHLRETFAASCGAGKLQLVEGDVLQMELGALGLFDRAFVVVANIPYYITGELLRMLLSGEVQPNRGVFLVQKEVAERIARSKKESILSISVKAYGEPHYVGTVPRGAFAPAPAVDSAILAIANISKDFFSDIDEEHFFRIVKTGFGQKRKQLAGNLERIADRAALDATWRKLGLESTVRAEDLPLTSWHDLARTLPSTPQR